MCNHKSHKVAKLKQVATPGMRYRVCPVEARLEEEQSHVQPGSLGLIPVLTGTQQPRLKGGREGVSNKMLEAQKCSSVAST